MSYIIVIEIRVYMSRVEKYIANPLDAFKVYTQVSR